MNAVSDAEAAVARTLAQIQLAAYQYPDSRGVVTPFAWDWSAQLKTKTAGFRVLDGAVAVILPGTQDWAQWEDDFKALPRWTDHPVFGRVHTGFWSGVEAFCQAMAPQLPAGKPVLITGHSLGAAEAPLVAAQLMEMGVVPQGLACFAPPRPGMRQLAEFLARVPKVLYRTVGTAAPYHDLVTDVPFSIPFAADYSQCGQLTDLTASPAADDSWLLFKYHHMQLYAAALAAEVPHA